MVKYLPENRRFNEYVPAGRQTSRENLPLMKNVLIIHFYFSS